MAKLSLPEIFVQLPDDVQHSLIVALEKSTVPSNVSRDHVITATEHIVHELKCEFSSASPEVYSLLDQVPQAVADALI